MTVRAMAGLVLLVATAARAGSPNDPVAFVNPFTGSDARAADFGTGGGAGNTFPGAVAPFGMVQWSPDTVPATVAFGDADRLGHRPPARAAVVRAGCRVPGIATVARLRATLTLA